ncbi:OmpA family protein [Sulfitobacter sp. LCG007]
MKQFLKSTTTLTLCVALSLPAGIVSAQSAADVCKGKMENGKCVVTDGNSGKAKKDGKKSDRKADNAKGEKNDKAARKAARDDNAKGDSSGKKAERAEKSERKDEARETARKDESAKKAEAGKDGKTSGAAARDDSGNDDAVRKAAAGDDKQRKASQDDARRDAKATDARDLSKAEKEKLKAERREAEKKRQRRAAAASAKDSAKDAEVRTEKFTDRNTRKSNQEFRDRLREERRADARDDDDDDDDGGLSTLEKALLLGAGAFVVGSILNNGDEVVATSDDRVVVDRGGELYVMKDDDALLRRPGNEMRTETFSDGSTRTITNEPDGSQIVTIRDYDGSLLSRTLISPQGEAYTLFDDTQGEQEVITSQLPRARPGRGPIDANDEDALRRALEAAEVEDAGRSFSLRQVRQIAEVRDLAPEIELSSVRFNTGSAAIEPRQAESLARIGAALRDLIEDEPRTVVLVEGHTDAVGDAAYNLALSDRRAESLALALTEYFDVPAENMIVQGYGESDLVVQTDGAEQRNRRAVVRNITDLLRRTDA